MNQHSARNFWREFGINQVMKWLLIMVLLAGLAAGCVTKSKARADARAEAQRAYLAGKNDALKEQLARQQASVTVVGPVQNATVPWVSGLTLAQAIATANYLSPSEPTQITLTRQGEDGVIDPHVLFNGVPIPLEPGDVITLK